MFITLIYTHHIYTPIYTFIHIPLFAGGHLPSRHNMEVPTKEGFTRYRVTQSCYRCYAPPSLCLLPNIPLSKRRNEAIKLFTIFYKTFN